jgi:uncharacterized protein YegP (UPF0339 family)
VDAHDTALSPDSRPHLEREPAGPHFRKVDAGRPRIAAKSAERLPLPEKPCRFNVFRADEFRTSSVLFAGGDWRWRLLDAAGLTLVEAGGYRSEDDCRAAVTMLRRHVPLAAFPTAS